MRIASIPLPGLGDHEAAFSVDGGTIVVRITASPVPHDPTRVVLLVETDRADTATGDRLGALPAYTANLDGSVFLAAGGLDVEVATQQDLACSRAASIFGVESALLAMPTAMRPTPRTTKSQS